MTKKPLDLSKYPALAAPGEAQRAASEADAASRRFIAEQRRGPVATQEEREACMARQEQQSRGRWSARAEQAAEQAKSVAEQRRTEEAAHAADQAEAAWVLASAAQRQRRDVELANTAAEQAKQALKDLNALREGVASRRVSEQETVSGLAKLRRERDRLARVSDSLDVSVASTTEMRDDPHAYLAGLINRYPSLGLADSPVTSEGGAPAATGTAVPVKVDRVRSLLESLRQEVVEAEDELLELSERQRRLAGLTAAEGGDLRAKYPGLASR